jgi:crotonobetainyl-CoA:carnitine CoA-transferase CaiB-like acyl-CoA transferase
MDNQAAYYNAASILIAHYARLRTGRGTLIDSSATEVGIGLLGPVLLDVEVNGRPTRRDGYPPGNRDLYRQAAPHGVYPCEGDDRWIAITVFSEPEWSALAGLLDDPSVARDERFATVQARYENQDALDDVIARWTVSKDAMKLTNLLQENGVQAGAVQNAEDLLDRDPQIRHRNVHFALDHPVVGAADFESAPIHFSRSQATPWRSAPLLGEDNEYVFGDLLGLSAQQRSDLEDLGAI